MAATQTEEDLDEADASRAAALSRITDRNILRLYEDIVERTLGIFIEASRAVVRRAEGRVDVLKDLDGNEGEDMIGGGKCLQRERLVVEVRPKRFPSFVFSPSLYLSLLDFFSWLAAG